MPKIKPASSLPKINAMPTAASSAPLINAPSNGATPGTWQIVQFSGNGIGMNYCVLLPYNYSSANSYPLLMYLHENGYGGDQTGYFCLYEYASQGEGCDFWFNNTTFRTNYPCIVVVPLLNEDQDSSGNTQNWGGWGGPDPQPSQLNCLTIIQTLISQYSVYTPKIYVTGDSLGGIGTWEFMIQYNAQTGLSGNKIFAAGWSESGGVLLYGDPPNQNVITAMQNVPMLAVRGAQDTSTGPDFDPQMYAAYGGGSANGSKAPNGNMYYINDGNLGHDVWFTYRNLTASFGSITPATTWLNWMFSQTSSGAVTPTIPTTPTPGTPTTPTTVTIGIITPTSGGSVTDASNNVWTLTSAGDLDENGTAVTGGAGTGGLTVVNGVIWAQDVNSGTWYTYVNGQFVSQGTATPPTTVPTVPSPTVPTPTVPTPTVPTPTVPTPTVPTPTIPTPTVPTPTIPTPTVPTPTIPTPTSPTPTVPTPTRPTAPTVPTPTILQAAENGVIEFSSAVSLLYYWQSVVYLKDAIGAWYSWNGSSFISSANPLNPTVPTIPTPTIPTPTIPTPTVPTPTRPTPTVPTPSPTTTITIITPTSGGSVTDATGNIWTLTSAGDLDENGAAVTGGAGTGGLTVVNGVIWAQDVNSGTWYTYVNGQFVSQGTATPGPSTPTAPTAPTVPTTPTTSTGNFKVANGLFYDPSGAAFTGRGVNITNDSLSSAVTNAACQPLTTFFPNIGFIRLACDGEQYPSVSAMSTYINRLVALNIVVAIEDHMYPQASPPTGSAQNNWYASIASYYINEPFVWFMSTNEPLEPGVEANHTAIYNAVRGTGSNAIVLFDPIGGGGPNDQGPGALNASTYANMTNVGWDQHFYAWSVGYSTNQATVNAGLATFIAQDQQISSQDGVMAVHIGEWGDSTDGESIDADWQNIVTAVTTSGHGSSAWIYDNFGTVGDQLINWSNNTLSAYGQLVSTYVSQGSRANRGSTNAAIAFSQGQSFTPTVTEWNTGTLMMVNNLTASSVTAVPQATRSTTTLNDGQIYFEITMQAGSATSFAIGLNTSAFNPSIANGLGSDAFGIGYYPRNQTVLVNNNQLTSGIVADDNGAVFSVAVDFTARKFWVSSPAMRSVGNMWNNTQTDDPATSMGGIDMSQLAPGPYYIAFNDRDSDGTAVLNVGGSRFAQPIPLGYTAWAAAVISAASILPTPTPTAPFSPIEKINWCNKLVLPTMQWVGNSAHVAIYYDIFSYTSMEGASICTQFLAQCETYYQTLVNWFNGYEPNNSNGLITLRNPLGSLINYFIVSNGSFQAGHCSCTNADILVDFAIVDRLNMDAIFCEFLLELSEVFMPSLSALPDCDTYALGEGMSNAMAIEMHSGGIGTTIANLATEWMDQTVAGVQRGDFVNNNVIYNTTDPTALTRLVGPGCCCVFFFYLRFQLFFSWPQITSALDTLPAQCNLQRLYQALTGDPNDPFPAFLTLLNSRYPASVLLGEFFNPIRLFPI